MQRIDAQQGVEAILVEQEAGHQHERAEEEMGDVEGERAHVNGCDMNMSSVQARLSISATPRKSGTRYMRILGDRGPPNRPSREPSEASSAISGDTERKRGEGGAGRRNAPGQEQASDEAERQSRSLSSAARST